MPRTLFNIFRFSGLLMASLALTGGAPEDDIRIQRIKAALDRFTTNYPQQKIYLHTDKASYRGGDEMWIKAYLLNGINHYPDSLSTNLYIELFGPSHTRIGIKRLLMLNGYGSGSFLLSDTLPEGLYQLRAYTSWMQNFNVDYYFRKDFQLANPGYTRLISPREARENVRNIAKREELSADFDVQFLPEGGSMVYDLPGIVGFKAVNMLGKGIAVSGEVYDDKNRLIVSFSDHYNGMGTFELTPVPGRRYHAIVHYNGADARFSLPRPAEKGLAMTVHDSPDKITVNLQVSPLLRKDRAYDEVFVTGQVRGILYFQTVQKLSDGKGSVVIEKSFFPSGIVQLTVFSGNSEPLAERLVFVDHHDRMNINFDASDVQTEGGLRTELNIRVTDSRGKPLRSNLSLAVTRNRSGAALPVQTHITSYMLLASDLRGTVENPEYYFNSGSPEVLKALDNLMLTQGWRRFDWNEILSGRYPEIRYFEEKGITISGRIVHDFFDIPLKDCKVQLTIMDEFNDVFTQYSDKDGGFTFENLYYYDTVNVKIEAWRTTGRRNLVIVLPEQEIREITEPYGDYYQTIVSERDNKAYRKEKGIRDRIAFRAEQQRLDTADNNKLVGIHGTPDATLDAEDIPKGTKDVLEAINGRIPGVMVNGDKITIRGPGSFYSSTQPLFLIDNLPVSGIESVKSVPIETIDRIEIIKGPQAAIYGSRGANGIIAIYTKRGQFMRRGVLELGVLGYYTPRTFYQPVYSAENEPSDNYTVFWMPHIVTDEQGSARIVLAKPIIEGDFRFVFEGVSFSGHTGFSDTMIENRF